VDDATLHWWLALGGVGVLNIAAWMFSALRLRRRELPAPGDSRRLQLLLSAGYVFGCAYRSWLPVFDIQRLCLVDTWLSSAIVGRSVATVAELCFAAQWAVLLRDLGRAGSHRVARGVSQAIVPMIAMAELCSWHAVLTTSNLGHVVEESIWGISAALIAACLWDLRRSVPARRRAMLVFMSAAGLVYVAYMFAVDVPMYWARWVSDEATGRHYLRLADGVLDAAVRRVVSTRWEDWRTEVVWMSLYFSVAVWLSIALVHVRLSGRSVTRAPSSTEVP
jgi:hypothetical protein